LRALAELGAGVQRSGDVAEVLGSKSQKLGPIRDRLIKKGMIYSPSHGDTEFTVPKNFGINVGSESTGTASARCSS